MVFTDALYAGTARAYDLVLTAPLGAKNTGSFKGPGASIWRDCVNVSCL